MLRDTANAIVRRLGNAVVGERPHGASINNRVDGVYNVVYRDGGCYIRRLADNRVSMRVIVPSTVGARYERRFGYFTNDGAGEAWMHDAHFKRVIIDADEEDALTTQTVVLMALVRVQDSEGK